MTIINKTRAFLTIFSVCVFVYPSLAMPDTLGNTTVGTRTDTHNSNVIHVSRFVTGAVGGSVTSMSVNVGNVAAAPNNQFQVAIYSDNNNSPANLIAKSASASLLANSWQNAAISATLAPNTAYWLAYNTNGTTTSVNNMRYSTGGTSAWTTGRVTFNTWPTSFGASTKAGVTYSIYATYTLDSPTAPTVNITAPPDGTTVSGTQTVAANATNAVGVQFKLDGANLGAEDTAAPFSASWDTTTVANGSHTLSAVARNSAGVTATSTVVTVTVNNVAQPPAPTVGITAPADGATVSGTQTVTATATNAVGVQFKLDGANLGAEDTAAPFSASWDTTTVANGSHTLSAVARNSAGATATSTVVTVTVNNVAQPPAPTVGITAPADGATVSGAQTVAANATNAVGVQFKLDGANLGAEDTAAPFNANWDTTTVANGSHTLSAVARNSAGATATNSVMVNVSNILPNADQPILLITDPANPYTKYYEEILKTEGIKTYNTRPLNQVDSVLLNNYDLVVLGEMALSDFQVTLLSDWVNSGGKLIAMRPDKKLAPLLGLAADATTLPNAYLKINNSTTPGLGIVGETIQYHGIADLYTLNGANAVAMLYSNSTTATPNPAVSMHAVGANGGQAAAFTFDLARSIIQTRQGNVAWAGQQRDGVDGYEASEMFFGLTGQPNWNNLDKAIIPIADEQQRLLVNMITEMEKSNMPLPRLWYLPRSLKAAIVMTGDDHSGGGTIGRFNSYISQSTPGCNVNNWECIRASSYVYAPSNISNAQASSFNSQGFEIGLHVTTSCLPWGTPAQLADLYTSQLTGWKAFYPSLPSPVSSRTHCVEWDDWATQAKTKLANGMRLDTDYYYFPASFVNGRPGYFNGAGMPMRFADLDGTIVDVFQATTQITDESGLDVNLAINTMLDKALGPEGYYTVVTANMHNDIAASAARADAIIAAAKARNIPIVSGRQMLQWLDARDASGIEAVSWNSSVLSFVVTGGGNGLTAMVPIIGQTGILSAINRSGGAPMAFSTQTVKGAPYAMFNVTPGTYFASYIPDTSAPVIQSTSPSNGAVNISTNTSISFIANEPLDVATTTSANVELKDSTNNLVASSVSYNIDTKTVILRPIMPLQTNTSYTALAKTGLKDLAGNPLAEASQVLFTTASQTDVIIVGNNQIGGLTDTGDNNSMNGTRFVNGAQQNNITSMSVYVRTVDSAPNNKFQLAIYADSNATPGALIAITAQGTLLANSWNSLAINASLQPNTAYWFVYNSNGRTSKLNNMAYSTGSLGQGVFSKTGVAFGAWPTIFGSATVTSAVYSIYAQ